MLGIRQSERSAKAVDKLRQHYLFSVKDLLSFLYLFFYHFMVNKVVYYRAPNCIF